MEIIIAKFKKVFLSFIFIACALVLFRPFIVRQLATRGDGYFGYGMFRDAVREYKKALILDSHNTSILNWFGYTYKCMNDMDKAISVYKKAIEIDSQNLIAYHDLGMIYAMDNKFKLAKQHFLKAITVRKGNKYTDKDYAFYHRASLNMLSVCYERLGEIRKAIEVNEKLLEHYPDSNLARERLKKLKNLER